MPKRIEFIAPIEAMRGNLSGNQDLRYAEDDNKAYYAPQGQTNYARNYTPRFIGAKRASDGRKYFSVRSRNGVRITSKSLQAMALMGGAGSMYAAIVSDKSTGSLYARLQSMWITTTEYGNTDTFRKWLTDYLRRMLATKAQFITIAGPSGSIQVNNPWVSGAISGEDVGIAQSILVKFWSQLAKNGITFHVNSLQGIAYASTSFSELTAPGTTLNILNLATMTIGDTEYVVINGNAYLLDSNGDYVISSHVISDGEKFTTTTVSPTA